MINFDSFRFMLVNCGLLSFILIHFHSFELIGSSQNIEIIKVIENTPLNLELRTKEKQEKIVFRGNRKIGKINVPILMIYGTKDMAIGEKAVDETKNYVNASYKLLKIKASHWLIQDSFDIISNEVLKHLKK